MNEQRNSFVGSVLAGVGAAFGGRRSSDRDEVARSQAPAMFESLEHRQMMSVSTLGIGLPAYTSSTGTSIMVKPAPTGYWYGDDSWR